MKRVGVESFITKLTNYLEQDFLRWQDFDKSARLAAHSDTGVIELMPIADTQKFSFKYVNGHPSNTDKNLLTVMAFGVLADVETGYPIILSELTLTTALRTAATSVMVAKKLARPNATTMALIGNGSQSEFQAIAFHCVLGITEIRCFDIDPTASEKLAQNLRHYTDLSIKICDSTKQATCGADIITTITADKKYATIITPDMVNPGVHINDVGGDCPGKTEIDLNVMKNARVFVEYEPQSRIEGEVQQLPADYPVTEFWRLLAEPISENVTLGRRSSQDITIFDSVGFALEDYSALRLVNELANEYNLGQDIELIPTLSDPKNLYSLLRK